MYLVFSELQILLIVIESCLNRTLPIMNRHGFFQCFADSTEVQLYTSQLKC